MYNACECKTFTVNKVLNFIPYHHLLVNSACYKSAENKNENMEQSMIIQILKLSKKRNMQTFQKKPLFKR